MEFQKKLDMMWNIILEKLFPNNFSIFIYLCYIPLITIGLYIGSYLMSTYMLTILILLIEQQNYKVEIELKDSMISNQKFTIQTLRNDINELQKLKGFR